jgi:ubiquinone/menaquinone biosynthesis C-methylase UbiE
MKGVSTQEIPYICPDCRVALTTFACESCEHRFPVANEIPILFSREPAYERLLEAATFYDELYETKENVWEVQGRTDAFIAYVAGLIDRAGGRRYLDLGCGEGYLLEAVKSQEKYGLDLSLAAIQKAARRADAAYCLGVAERLPYPSDYFNVVSSVGTMEHFLDDRAATREVVRVLRQGGRYVVVLFVETTIGERFRIKTGEFLYPSFRPTALVRWAWRKATSSPSIPNNDEQMVQQPIQNQYTPHRARRLFEACGFTVQELITKRTHPEAPLEGHHMVVFILQKNGKVEG